MTIKLLLLSTAAAFSSSSPSGDSFRRLRGGQSANRPYNRPKSKSGTGSSPVDANKQAFLLVLTPLLCGRLLIGEEWCCAAASTLVYAAPYRCWPRKLIKMVEYHYSDGSRPPKYCFARLRTTNLIQEIFETRLVSRTTFRRIFPVRH